MCNGGETSRHPRGQSSHHLLPEFPQSTRSTSDNGSGWKGLQITLTQSSFQCGASTLPGLTSQTPKLHLRSSTKLATLPVLCRKPQWLWTDEMLLTCSQYLAVLVSSLLSSARVPRPFSVPSSLALSGVRKMHGWNMFASTKQHPTSIALSPFFVASVFFLAIHVWKAFARPATDHG